MAKKQEEDEFEAQLRQEELARLAKEDGAYLTRGATYVDDDGTVMEWDHERKAYFPKIDADFIAQYQINYGAGVGGAQQGHPQDLTEEQKKAQEAEYWRNYYAVYSQQQPALPKFDEDGNPIEGEEEEDGEGENKRKKKDKNKEGVNNEGSEETNASSSSGQEAADPTSEEVYQYNLYYYGQEYADAYRDYYLEHPDAEAMPDFVAESKAEADPKKQDNSKKGKKRGGDQDGKPKEPKREEGWFDTPESNTQLYVSNLPLDVEEEEFKELMSKCGLIMFDPQTHKPKIKVYKDHEGNVKGDALCTYIKPESVELALNILDGWDLRGHAIKVERAKFELKGEYDPKKKKKKLSNKAKQKLKERQQRLFDWRPDKNPLQRGKHERVVVLKNMFNIKEFEENPALINELRTDVRSECVKFGEVTKVTLYDRNPEGVITVTFKEPEEADQCITALHGRWFAKLRVDASTWDGKTKFDVIETEEERTRRLQEWEAYLQGEKVKDKGTEAAEAAGSSGSGGGAEQDATGTSGESDSAAV
ncbi:HIV Tat-specific factor 1 [Elysia marginata]|uniref:17S U2 SnRNP complex component HTATSF1 n=1 Tax=Elysia marginata TaxID=1093978 RepID=A0AAV4GQU6_9GAST|nr:HIV Tat-specific factor 1 [Elysia marginata]